MSRIYSYCSYKQSPAGFQLGCAEVSRQEKIHLSGNGIDEFVRQSFESGIIKKVYGKLLRTDRYIYIVKKLKYTSENEDEYASVVHMNFAFEFEAYEEYSCFANGISKMNSEELASLFHEVIMPDTSEETFALLINGRIMCEAIEKITSLGKSIVSEEDIDITHFLLNSKQTSVEKISEIYKNITDIDTALYKKSDYEIILKKKKSIVSKKQNCQEQLSPQATRKNLGMKIVEGGFVVTLVILLLLLLLKIFRS